VSSIVVGPPLGRPEDHWQDQRVAIQRLDLTLLVDAQDQGAIRRSEVEARDIAHFIDEQRVPRQPESRCDCACRPKARQRRPIVGRQRRPIVA